MNPLYSPHPDLPAEPGAGVSGDLPLAALFRLAADGELSPEQEAALEAHLAAHPEDEARVEFEASLRNACARACCGCGCAPPDLRGRIEAMVAGSRQGPSARSGAAPAAPDTRSRSFWLGTSVARFAAAAAVVAIVAVAGFLAGQAQQANAPGRLVIEPPTGRVLAASMASFARREHDRCTDGGPAVDGKFSITDPAAAPDGLAAIAGEPVTIPCILRAREHGLEFVDAGLCHPPTGDALHIRFRTASDALVSLWVQPDDGQLEIEDGVTYTMGEGADCVRFWRVEGMRYVLVCPDVAAAPLVSRALESPDPVRTF